MKFQSVLLWLAVLPVAIAGTLLSDMLAHLPVLLVAWLLRSWSWPIYLVKGYMGFVDGTAFVYFGACVAPHSHRHVAFALAGLLLLLSCIVAVPVAYAQHWDNLFRSAIMVFSAFFTALIAGFRDA